MKLLAKRLVPTPKQLPAFNNYTGEKCQCEQCTLYYFGYIMYVLEPMPISFAFGDIVQWCLSSDIYKMMKRSRMWSRERLIFNRTMRYGFPVWRPTSIIRITGL